MYNPSRYSFPSAQSSFPARYCKWLGLKTRIFAWAAPLALASGTAVAAAQLDTTRQAHIADSFFHQSLSFEANLGQTDPKVQFLSRSQGYSLFLTPTEAVLNLRKTDSTYQFKPSKLPSLNFTRPAKSSTISMLRMQLEGANAHAQAEGIDELPGKTHYLRGKDPKAWRIGIPNYAKVKYNGIYPGIDLVYYGKQRQLEYDFIVAPGADPNTIRFHVEGAEQLHLDSNGQLIVKTEGGEVIQRKPVIYQEIGGVRKEVTGGYALHPVKEGKTAQIGFQVARYDLSKPLIIDPVLAYSTYWGGSSGDIADDIAVDGSGNAYITGTTGSVDFPIVKGAQPFFGGGSVDTFITKFSPKGNKVIYSTYLGGGDYDEGESIAVDNQGNAIVSGYTTSADFPTHLPLQAGCLISEYKGDVFVAKLNAAGTAFVYATCLGGTDQEFSSAIAVDRWGNAYVTALTRSTDFPLLNPLQVSMLGDQDPFITKISPTGSLVYSTYFGGSETFGEASESIAVDKFGNAYIVGWTTASDFPTVNPLQPTKAGDTYASDAFVAKLNASGSALIYSTYLGGQNIEICSDPFCGWADIAVDSPGNAYVTGTTNSSDFPMANPLQSTLKGFSDAFVTKLNAAGSALLYSTYLGGDNENYGNRIAVNGQGNAYIAGSTNSQTFPMHRTLQKSCAINSSYDVTLTKLNVAGTKLIYSTCIGGGNNEDSLGIALDRYGNAYLAGDTNSTDFPTFKALHPNLEGDSDAFVTKIVGK